jgi:prepilin-type N-terminal cleavage/methylation domain-containing protein
MKGLPAGRQGFSALARRKGFTLVETIIVAAVFLIVGTLLASILVNNTGLSNSQSSLVTSGLNINDAVSTIENNIRQASSVAIGYPEVTPTYTTSSNTLVLKIPSYNASGVISDTYDYVVVTKDLTKTYLLKQYIFPNALSIRQSQNKILTNILQSIEFSYLDKNDNVVSSNTAEKVKVIINVLPGNGVADKTRSATIVVSLRNL